VQLDRMGDYQNNELSTILHVSLLPANLSSSYFGALGYDESCEEDYIIVLKLKYEVPTPPIWEEGER